MKLQITDPDGSSRLVELVKDDATIPLCADDDGNFRIAWTSFTHVPVICLERGEDPFTAIKWIHPIDPTEFHGCIINVVLDVPAASTTEQ